MGLGDLLHRLSVEGARERRAAREAVALARETRKAVGKHGYSLPADAVTELDKAAAEVLAAAKTGDHDATVIAMVRLEEQRERHLSFARKSTFREYADSIGVAVLIALFLRAFVVEAFKIPSGSMIPTMEVGDHIFVNKFLYGPRIPLTRTHLFGWRKPRRGEVIVFIYPEDPSKDFIKRIVGVQGDSIRVEHNVLYINGKAIERRHIPGDCDYLDYDDRFHKWERKYCTRFEEVIDGTRFMTILDPHGRYTDFPDGSCPQGTHASPVEEACIINSEHVFVMGDNRNNSSDSRYWGAVPIGNITGKALVIWWSSGGPAGIRWDRMGKLVD